MTEQETSMINIMQHCILNDGFCDSCENNSEDYKSCRETYKHFFDMVKEAFAQRNALLTDLNLACKKNNPCLVCGHFRPDMNGKCDLLGWACSWEWRGVTNG